ncbi:MAG: hypothetical protein J2P37_35810, partial [Ktedonobacteraceae bacterium]|nr:hypothetical protein [Ktedonobacteraceae bacterium]
PILGTSRQPSSLPESSDPLVNAAYHWAQWACHHQPSLSSAIDLRQLAYEMGSTWCLASASPRQQGPLSAFVHAIITASVETVQWTVVLDQLAQISLPAQTEA